MRKSSLWKTCVVVFGSPMPAINAGIDVSSIFFLSTVMAPQQSWSPEPWGCPTQVYITFSSTTTTPSTAPSTKKSAAARKILKSSKTKTFDYQFSGRTPALESYTAFTTALLTHSTSAKYIPLLEKKRYISFKMSTKKMYVLTLSSANITYLLFLAKIAHQMLKLLKNFIKSSRRVLFGILGWQRRSTFGWN